MKFFKVLLHSAAFFIGLLIAFSDQTNYEKGAFEFPPEMVKESGFACGLVLDTRQAPILEEGKKLFKLNCASCHNKNMIDHMTGPALGGTQERWKGREELLYQWIQNSSKVIATGDSYAVALYNEYNKSVMTAFPNLEKEEIDAILAYIDYVY